MLLLKVTGQKISAVGVASWSNAWTRFKLAGVSTPYTDCQLSEIIEAGVNGPVASCAELHLLCLGMAGLKRHCLCATAHRSQT